jgi:hypothetical protein
MHRRDFVRYSAMLTAGVSLEFTAIAAWFNEDKERHLQFAAVSKKLQNDFLELLQWLKTNGWRSYLENELGVDLGLKGDKLVKELTAAIDPARLSALRTLNAGFDDFAGESLIQPGFPAYSLLFHTLASPRVRPQGVTSYPGLAQIDLLENYIYALSDWEQLKALYDVKPTDELVFAVFAYEYRPAFKTPHHLYADMVYSRTGIGRIGDQPANYDAINRCHTNKPAGDDKEMEKRVAVIPARYGLFLARKVDNESISLITSPSYKGAYDKDDRNDGSRTFLQPIRKIFNDDVLTGEMKIKFIELHKSEKLKKLALSEGIVIEKGIRPTTRTSKDLVNPDTNLSNVGSSFLLMSQHAPLIRLAKEGAETLYFRVPKQEEAEYDNRYFTALATQEVEDVELLGSNANLRRRYNRYQAPRNQPLFVNITNKKDSAGTGFNPIPQANNFNFEDAVKEGTYAAPLFEDSICDGRVTVNTDGLKLEKINNIAPRCLPAFSIVTAPDFFPQVDPLDLVAFDIAPGTGTESHFYEGGVASLSTARIKPNPKVIDTKSDPTANTYLAVLSNPLKKNTTLSPEKLAIYKDPSAERGYEISGFLPDVASSVFAPGWDVTYCSLDDVHDIYVGTEGLGSPFVEDMKFCSALNGMWPATSPDAARTYQGGNEWDYRNPTAVPLLDEEIGLYKDGPSGKESWGWDGEQGPYLEKVKGQWKVNFTDLGRADAIDNALKGKLDMSQLRKLKSRELINRMECLKLCIATLPQKNFNPEKYNSRITAYTYLWLVSAEKVNWGKEDAAGLGIPANLAGKDKKWITDKANAKISGEGYLYVFSNSAADGNPEDKNPKPKEWTNNLKRRRLNCQKLYICQVTNDPTATKKIAWTEVDLKTGRMAWRVK